MFRSLVKTILVAVMAGGCISPALAAGEGWTADFQAAKEKAAAENKSLLIDFTGSDWCGWCIRLKEEVFSKEAFTKGVEGDFVLVEIDFPQDETKLSAETKAQNEKLAAEYAVEGFPTIMLTNAAGRPYAQTGYQEGGPEAYLEHLGELSAVRKSLDENFAKAEGMEGVEKAQVLVAALKSLEMDAAVVARFYGDEIAMIKASDPEDATGYVKGIEADAKFAEFENKLNELGNAGKFDEAMVLVEDTLKSGGFEGERQQNIMFIKAVILAEKGQFDEAILVIDAATEVAPDSELAGNFDQVKARINELREASKPSE